MSLCAFSAQANLLVNGDFEEGYSGFTSDYTLNEALSAEGTYAVRATSPWAPTYASPSVINGNMLVVNASGNTAASFWTQTISVNEGDECTFSGDIASLTYAPFPNLQLKVNGVSVGTHLVSTDGQWEPFSFNWTAPGSSLTLSLHDLAGQPGGDDFAVDGLSAIPEPSVLVLSTVFGGGVMMIRRIFMI